MMSVLSIDLDEVTEEPKRFLLHCDTDWWERSRELLREPDARIDRPLAVDLEGHRLGARLLFRGTVEGDVELGCGFCLERFVHHVRETLELLLDPAPTGAVLPESGVELDAEEESVGRYTGDEIDLGPAVVELLALGWPMHPRCREDCRGLCPACGVNRNHRSCSCTDGDRQRPFAGLANMLNSGERDE